MNNFFSVRNLVIGMAAMLIGGFAFFGIVGAWSKPSVTVTGKVAAFVLNPEGKVDGAILETGDQIKFGAQTGEIVTQQIKIGDSLAVTGEAGDGTIHGRELTAKTLQIGEQTITVVGAGKKPHERGGKGKRHERRKGDKPMPMKDEQTAANNPPMTATENAQPLETIKANGKVRFVLVGKRGEVKGLILANGEQMALPKAVKDANLTFNSETEVSVEGAAMRGEFGVFIKPTQLTVGTQTFSFNK